MFWLYFQNFQRSVCLAVCAITFERFKFMEFCLRRRHQGVKIKIKFENGRNGHTPPWGCAKGLRIW